MNELLTKRDIVKCIIFSIITCGIYDLYWRIVLAQETVRFYDVRDGGTVEIVLMIFFPPVGFYLCEQKFAKGCTAHAINHDDNALLYLVLGLVGWSIVSQALLQNEINKICDGRTF